MDGDQEHFEIGDWVTWRFAPFDKNGPYHNDKVHWLVHAPGHEGEADPIAYELEHFEPPPYKVCRVLEAQENLRGFVGHTQIVVVRMIPSRTKLAKDPTHPNPDFRTFSGKLFVKVPSVELVLKLRYQCRAFGDKLPLKYKPPG